MLKMDGMFPHIVPTPAKMIGCLLPSRHRLVYGNSTPENFAGIIKATGQGNLSPLIARLVPLSEAIPTIVELEKTGAPKGKLVIAPMR